MDVAITRTPGVLPSAESEAFLARHAVALAHFAEVATAIPGTVLVTGPADRVVTDLGLPPPSVRFDILTAVMQAQDVAARLPRFASVLTQRMAELEPGQVVIILLLLPEGSGLVVASFALESGGDA